MSEGTHIRNSVTQEWFARGSEGERMLAAQGRNDYGFPGLMDEGGMSGVIGFDITLGADMRCNVCGWFRHASISMDNDWDGGPVRAPKLTAHNSSGSYPARGPEPRDRCEHCAEWQQRVSQFRLVGTDWIPFFYDWEPRSLNTLPHEETLVFIHVEDEGVDVGFFDGFTWRNSAGSDDIHVTHWMPLVIPNDPGDLT